MVYVHKEVELYLGSMGWSYNFWPLYEGLKPAEFLRYYAEHFNSVEINSSFYRIPSKRVVENWANQVPDRFRFTAKFPHSISHASGLNYEEEKLEVFLRNISKLGEKIGPLLLQFPRARNHTYAVEFRHKGWFRDKTYELLRENNVSLVQVDHPRMPTSYEQTTDFVYIRWEGDRKQVNGEIGTIEIDKREEYLNWSKTIRGYQKLGLNVYGYFSKYYSGYPVSDIKTIIEASLRAVCNDI